MGALMELADGGYHRIVRPLFFRLSPDNAHVAMLRMLTMLDAMPTLAKSISPPPLTGASVQAGGVSLSSPVMVAAGLVKGHGFSDENEAVEAAHHINLLPGWWSIPLMCGAVEIGSFTRYPRLGNTPPVMWRDVATRSTQNRIGLKNPGAQAASVFLGKNRPPATFGISIATTPGEGDPAVQAEHVAQSIAFFLQHEVKPAWFTINLSCPNTEDDPQAAQTEQLAAQVAAAAVQAAGETPVWVKIGPDLNDYQYQVLIEAFAAAGVRAVVATNTLAAPVTGQAYTAGLAGGRLFERALSVVLKLFSLRERQGYPLDIIGCGGVMDGETLHSYMDAGAQAAQVWSGLVYRGPFAPFHIAQEYAKLP